VRDERRPDALAISAAGTGSTSKVMTVFATYQL